MASESSRTSTPDDEGFVFLVSSGEYSDYIVHCAFMLEADAAAYAHTVNRVEIEKRHRGNVDRDYTPPNAHLKCTDPLKDCPGCGEYWRKGEWEYYVERVSLHPAGEIPTLHPTEYRI